MQTFPYPGQYLKFSHISYKDTSENRSRNKRVLREGRNGLSYQAACAVPAAPVGHNNNSPKGTFEILDSYIPISNYDLQPQIIFCLSLGYLAMNFEAGRQKPSSHEPGWCFRAEGSRN